MTKPRNVACSHDHLMLMNSIWSVMLCLGLPVLTPLSDPLAELVLALDIL